ncbi:MAG: M42 family metallopeptidase [Bacilli bacterium]|jgi:endoglucanase|nr:M42 family metallopeptidase [Bacilli bacterium]
MNKEERLLLLKEVSEVRGISGNEREVSCLIQRYLKDDVDHFEFDNLGSTLAYLPGEQGEPTVLFTAHMDEIGFMVLRVEESGLIRLGNVGGWWGHVIPAHEFVVKTRDGHEYIGVTGAQPPHGMPADQKNKVMELKDMYLDLGVDSRKQIEDMGIRIGDTVTPLQSFRVMNNGTALLGKAWDDRASVAVGIEVIKNLKARGHKCNVVFAGTVQEEVGLRGAGTAAYHVKPDVAFATDVAMSYDLPGAPNSPSRLGAGVALSIMDSSVIAHRGLFDWVEAIAKERKIKYCYDLLTAGGTDSGAIHKQFDGIVNMTVSLPCRYFHSHVSIIDYNDYVAMVELMTEAIARIDNEVVDALKESKH